MATSRRFRLPSWAPWLLVVAALPFGAISWLAARAASNRSQAWPALRQVMVRLEDPLQARRLWERNPGLHGDFPDAESFQAELATWLPRFGGLPAAEPVESSGSYGIGADPFSLHVELKGRGGAWVYMSVEGYGAFGPGVGQGEGLVRLHFAEARAALTERLHQFEDRRARELWARYRQVEIQLRSESEVRRLWAREARLHQAYRAQEDLLRATAAWRKPLPALPEDITSAPNRPSLRREETPMGRTESVGYPGPEGLMLWVTWRDGCLEGIDPTLEVHGH
jgi:hypothetical protein